MSRPPQDPEPSRRRPAKRRRLLAGALSLASHGAIVLALLSAAPTPPKVFDPEPVSVELVAPPAPPAPAPPEPKHEPKPKPKRQARAKPAKAKAAQAKPEQARPAKTKAAHERRAPEKAEARPRLARRAPAARDRRALPASDEAAVADADGDGGAGVLLSEGQLAGAAGSGSGPPGRACNMARTLEAALARDGLVRSAVSAYAGKAIMVWNGDWVRSPGEDGKGLAAVREAILWAVAFAPKACRSEPMHGLVVISLDQGRGVTRLAVGQGEWRWSDLLTPRAER